LLFGKRYLVDDSSYYFLAEFLTILQMIASSIKHTITFSIEIGAHWFHSKKKRFHLLYGLIPFGKSIGLGRSFGLKLHANIARKSDVGMSCNFGLGWHKKYK
jgi:hypothetical protein